MGSSAVTKIGGSGGGSKITINQQTRLMRVMLFVMMHQRNLYVKAFATTTEFAEAIGIVETRTDLKLCFGSWW